MIRRELYKHLVFDLSTDRAQRGIWSLQGVRNAWFYCARFGFRFHEDGIQAGLAIAKDIGGLRPPSKMAQESARGVRTPLARPVEFPIGLEEPA